MISLFDEKRLATKFQILIEIAANQPHIRQKTIASNVNLTAQAISLYVREMVNDGWIETDGRTGCHITRKGVDWIMKILREIRAYMSRVEKIPRSISVSAAVAGCNIKKGQTVSLDMIDGILVASKEKDRNAKGIAVSGAMQGEDIGISCINGIIDLEQKKVKIFTVPVIQKGGSRKVNLEQLRSEINSDSVLCAIGLEAIVALNQAGMKPKYIHGVREVVIEATRSGLGVEVACVTSETHFLTQALDENNIEYNLINTEHISD